MLRSQQMFRSKTHNVFTTKSKKIALGQETTETRWNKILAIWNTCWKSMQIRIDRIHKMKN